MSLLSLVSYRDVLQSSFEVKATGRGVIVTVSFELHASISEDGGVVPPGGFGQVHIMWPCVESSLWRKILVRNLRHNTHTKKSTFLTLCVRYRRTLPKSCLQYAEIRFLRWSGQWCSVGRRHCCTDLNLKLSHITWPAVGLYQWLLKLTLPLFKTSFSSPRASWAQALLNSPRPPMARYSLSSCLAAIIASAWKQARKQKGIKHLSFHQLAFCIYKIAVI